MYPNSYLNLFPAFPRKDNIFVAMDFSPQFTSRWESVISPAIASVMYNSVTLQPHRVDTSKISDSILTEILDGIANDRLIFCDITSRGTLDGRSIRNGNVMYELGLAHAVRLPEEVIIFRSDQENLLFDMTNIRVNTYSPDENPGVAQDLLVQGITEAFRELDLKRHFAVELAANSMDFACWSVLLESHNKKSIQPSVIRTMGEVLGSIDRNRAIARLLEMGALSTQFQKINIDQLSKTVHTPSEHLLKYFPTPFGSAIMDYATSVMEPKSLNIHDVETLIGK